MKKLFFTLLTLTVLAFGLNAQITTPSASPSAELEQMVGLTEIEVEYSRPSAKGRTIFAADGLVPYGDIWRTGANSATKITFSDDVNVGGKDMPEGSYAILTKPMADQWEFMFFPYEKSSWSSYKDQTPAATFTAKTMKSGRMVESFTIEFNDLRDESANLEFAWANTYVSVPVKVDADTKVMKDIEAALAGTTAREYYDAGSYYHKAGKDINQAYEWVHKGNEMDQAAGTPRFWRLRREALILADMNRMGDAIQTATRSKELAMEAGNKDYVRMNEKSIEEWTMKAKAKGKGAAGAKPAAKIKAQKM